MNILFTIIAIICVLLGVSIIYSHFIAGKEDHGVEGWVTKDGRRWVVAYVEQADVYRAHISLEFDGRYVHKAILEADTLKEAEAKVRDWFECLNAQKVNK